MADPNTVGRFMHAQPIIRILLPAPWNLGPGKIRLLAAIQQTGSLSGAARHLHISYKRAWDMLDSINRNCPAPLVETATGGVRGGGAWLTEHGSALLTAYQEMDARARDCVAREATDLMKLLLP